MFDLWAMGKSTEGGVQPTQSAASDISYFCLISSCSLSHLFQNPVILPAILPFLRVLLVYLSCFLQTKLWIWVISIYFTVSPVWSGDCEREGLTLRWLAPRLAPKLIRNHHHREGFFYWEVLWLILCFPHLQHLERAFDSTIPFSWTTRIGSTNEWGFCHPQKSCLDHLKAKAALWENPGDEGTPRLKLGEAAATYAGTNVLVGPGVMSRQRSHPPRHVSPLCGAEEGGGGELNC